MRPFFEFIDHRDDTTVTMFGFVIFGFCALGVRYRNGNYGGDIALVVLGMALGVEWGNWG